MLLTRCLLAPLLKLRKKYDTIACETKPYVETAAGRAMTLGQCSAHPFRILATLGEHPSDHSKIIIF